MSPNDKDYKKYQQNEEEGDGESGHGGKSGEVEFRDFIKSGENIRDDQLPADEIKRLLIIHKDTHELRVKKQKEQRERRQEVKEGKISLQTYRQEKGLGGSQFKNHPHLSNKAQFSGIDSQVNALPNENIANTNDDKRNELELGYQYRLEHRQENTSRLTPKLTR